MRSLALAALIIPLAACSPSSGGTAADTRAQLVAPRPQPANRAAAAEADTAAPAPLNLPMMAYSYGYALEAPAKAIRTLVDRHEAACQAAGPAVCQLVGAQITETGEDRVHGELTLRATPAWVQAFRDGLEGDTKAAGGRVVRAKVDSEDLSRQIVDTEAAVRARTVLRDRLQGLLATRPGKLSELLEVEQELARVQGEIDATQSELAVMRGRVATSEVKLTYDSSGVLAPQGVFAPLGAAVRDFVGIVVLVVAGLVRLLAYVLPVAILAGAAFWLLRGRFAKAKRAPPPVV